MYHARTRRGVVVERSAMHEWALAEGVIRAALLAGEQEGLPRLTRVVVRIGELQRIDPQVFREALRAVPEAADPRLSGADLDIEVLPVLLCCRSCQHRFGTADAAGRLDEDAAEAVHFVPELAHAFLSCPACHSPDFEVVQGRGVWLQTVEGG